MIEVRKFFLSSCPESALFESTTFCCGEASESYLYAGNDSLVYHFGDKVIKVYKMGPWKKMPPLESFSRISFYQEITNRASSLAERENWQLELPFSRQSIRVRVNPIDKIVACGCCGSYASVSGFINGKNLEEIEKSSLPFDHRELKTALPRFSADLDDSLLVSGINVIPINIKFWNQILIITDLCADVYSLRRSGFWGR